MIQRGVNPYIGFNWADKNMLNKLKGIKAQGIREKVLKSVATVLWETKARIRNGELKDPKLISQLATETTPAKQPRKREVDISPEGQVMGDSDRRVRRRFTNANEDVDMNEPREEPHTDPPNTLARVSSDPSKGRHETGISSFHGLNTQFTETATVRMPYKAMHTISCDLTPVRNATIFKINMVSIYDVIKSISTTDGAPYHRAYWDNYYTKYSVLGCNWKISMRDEYNDESSQMICYQMYTSTVDPKIVSTGTTPASECELDIFYRNIPNVNKTYLKAPENNSTFLHNRNHFITTIKGHYKPGDIKTEVRDDNDINIWTDIGSTPALPEDLCLVFQDSDFSTTHNDRTILC